MVLPAAAAQPDDGLPRGADHLDRPVRPAFVGATIVEEIPREELNGESVRLSNRIGGDLPLYLTEWFSVVVLFLWFVVPVSIAYWRFQRADLN